MQVVEGGSLSVGHFDARVQGLPIAMALARTGREYCQVYRHGPNRAQVVDVLVKYKAMADRALADKTAWQARDSDGRFNRASPVDVQDWFFDHGMLKAKAPASRLVDMRYADAAAKALGPFQLINTASSLAGCR